MRKRLICLPAGVLAVVLIVAGCGGGDDETSTASITKAEFVKQADIACKDTIGRIQADFLTFAKESKASSTGAPTKQQTLELVDVVLVPNLKQEVDEFRALGAPSGDEDQVEAIVAALEEGVEEAENDPEGTVERNAEVWVTSSELASAYGLKDCGSR